MTEPRGEPPRVDVSAVASTTHDVLVVDDRRGNLLAVEAAIGDLAPEPWGGGTSRRGTAPW